MLSLISTLRKYPEGELLDLARGGAREVGHLPDLLWPLLTGQAGGLEVGPDGLEVGGGHPGGGPDERTAVLAEALVGRRHHGDLGHARHAQEQALDLRRADVLTARMITSLARSVMVSQPSSSSTPMSPVRYQPSASVASAVS